MSRAVLSAVLAAFLVAACAAGATTPTPEPAAPSASPVATPGPSIAPTPAATMTPAASVTPWTASTGMLAWHRLGEIPVSGITAVVGFDDGYVAIDGGSAWFSSDGRAWKRVVDAFGRALATNGRQVLVVGGYQHEPCGRMPPGSTGGLDCASSPVAWVSDDGVTWRKADLVPGDDEQSELVAAWPVADGWVAAMSDWYGVCLGGSTLWHSGDGISWEGYAPKPPAPWEGYEHAPLGVVGAGGQSLLAASERGGDGTTLASMIDGGSWRVLRGFPGTGAEVFTGAGPAGDRSRWVLGGLVRDTSGCGEDDGDDCGVVTPTIWSSTDGADWTVVTLPVGPGVPASEQGNPPVKVSTVTGLVLSAGGYVAVGVDGGSWAEGARHETWVSDDGVDWVMLSQPEQSKFDFGPGLVADGPAGVIGFSDSAVEDQTVVWQLR